MKKKKSLKNTADQETATNCDCSTKIWDKTRQQDLLTSSIQKPLAKVEAILAVSTETLVQLREKKLPEVE